MHIHTPAHISIFLYLYVLKPWVHTGASAPIQHEFILDSLLPMFTTYFSESEQSAYNIAHNIFIYLLDLYLYIVLS